MDAELEQAEEEAEAEQSSDSNEKSDDGNAFDCRERRSIF